MLARILIVEDGRIVAFNLRRRLAALGREVPAIAASGEEALRMAQEFIPFPLLFNCPITFLEDARPGSDNSVPGLCPSGAHRESPSLARSSTCISRHHPSAGTR